MAVISRRIAGGIYQGVEQNSGNVRTGDSWSPRKSRIPHDAVHLRKSLKRATILPHWIIIYSDFYLRRIKDETILLSSM